YLLFVALGVFAVLALFAILIDKYVFKDVAVIYAALIFCFWIQGNLLVYDLGNLDGHAINWEEFRNFYLIEFLLWTGILVTVLWFRKFLYRNLNTLLVLLLLFEGIPLLITGFQQHVDQETNSRPYYSNEHKFEFSSDKNVIVIVLDTVR